MFNLYNKQVLYLNSYRFRILVPKVGACRDRRDASAENQSILFATEVGVTLDARKESGATSRQAKGRLSRRVRSF